MGRKQRYRVYQGRLIDDRLSGPPLYPTEWRAYMDRVQSERQTAATTSVVPDARAVQPRGVSWMDGRR